VAKIKKT